MNKTSTVNRNEVLQSIIHGKRNINKNINVIIDMNKKDETIPIVTNIQSDLINPTNNGSFPLSTNLIVKQSTPVCVLEKCGRYPIGECLNHTEERCVPTQEGCKFE